MFSMGGGGGGGGGGDFDSPVLLLHFSFLEGER